MSIFKKKTWKRGDKLKIADLNRFEDGIASGSSNVYIAEFTVTNAIEDNGALEFTISTEETFDQLMAAYKAGKMLYAKLDSSIMANNQSQKTFIPLFQVHKKDEEENKLIAFESIVMMGNSLFTSIISNDGDNWTGAMIPLSFE